MTETKSTKRAFLASLVALMLCIAMLLGTTYAWFTDSVTSGRNMIQSGNLDVELEYSTDGTTWNPVTEDTSIFGETDLWEPGHTEAVALRVSNKGTLALKYDLSTTVYLEKPGINVYDEEFLLSEYLDVYQSAVQQDGEVGDIYMGLITGSRPNATSGMDKIAFDTPINNPTPSIQPGQAHVVALAVQMPTTVGNEANYKTGTEAPEIQFGVNLLATQVPYESDSYGTDYDANAEFMTMPKAIVAPLAPEKLAINATAGIGGAATAITLDSGYQFNSPENVNDAADSPYKYWHADFVVKADKDVAAESIALAGYYKEWCQYNNNNWVALTSPDTIKAGQEIRLVEALGATVNYEELCTYGYGNDGFQCGVANLATDGSNDGTTITVELRLFETEEPSDENGNSKNVETGASHVIGMFTYTF